MSTRRCCVADARARDSVEMTERLFAPDGGLVANAPHIPVHLGAMADTVEAMRARFPSFSPGDAYVTKVHPFTNDLKAFDSALQQIQANGGGDYPESVNQGLDQAVSRMQWSKGTAKLVFLVGDAPPHMDYQGDVRYMDSAVGAVARGIKIHSIAASGLEPKGSPGFRQVAQLTRGKFIFIDSW